MSGKHSHSRATGARQPPWVTAFLVAWFMLFHSACAGGLPLGGHARARAPQPREEAPPAQAEAPASYVPSVRILDEVGVLVPGGASIRPMSLDGGDFQDSLRQLAQEVSREGSLSGAARELLEERLTLTGHWLAEVHQGRVLTLVPLDDDERLTPVEEAKLRADYLGWCAPRGGGDCLELFRDGPYLRTDDRRTLALALAFGSVLDEAREALARELDVRMVLASLVWALGVYFAMWLVPEPTTKAAAGALTLLLVGWLGVETLWELVEGWARLATQAHRARTLGELRAAGAEYAKVLGKDAARALLLAVAALTGRTLAEVASATRTLPGYGQALARCEAQGLQVPLPVAVQTVEAVVVNTEGALTVLATLPGAPAGAMLSRDGSRGGLTGPGGQPVTVIIRHRKGNMQVVLGNGQRWHIPPGKSPRDIPMRCFPGRPTTSSATGGGWLLPSSV